MLPSGNDSYHFPGMTTMLETCLAPRGPMPLNIASLKTCVLQIDMLLLNKRCRKIMRTTANLATCDDELLSQEFIIDFIL